MKILITGGYGFIGSNFIINQINNKKNQILNYDILTYAANLENLKSFEKNDLYQFVKGDIQDSQLLNSCINNFKPDVIVNFAAESHVDRSFKNSIYFSKANYMAVHRFLEMLRLNKFKGRLLHISTDEVYGTNLKKTAKEDYPLRPTNPYSVSKAAADMLCQTYSKCYDLNILIVRPNNIFGPYQHIEKLIPATINAAYGGKKLIIHGNGLQKRSFLNSDDFFSACELLLSKNWDLFNNRVFNISSNNEYKVIDIIKKIAYFKKVNFKTFSKFGEDRPFNDLRYLISSRSLKSLGWVEKISFEKSLLNLYRKKAIFLGQ